MSSFLLRYSADTCPNRRSKCGVEFSLIEISGATEGNRAGRPEQSPLPLRRLNRDPKGGTGNSLASNKEAVHDIESKNYEMSALGRR